MSSSLARPVSARVFFQLMSWRYERASTVLTSNKSFEEWGEIFGDEVMASALIDRLVHHCHKVNIRGNSYRMKNHAALAGALRHETDTPCAHPHHDAQSVGRTRRSAQPTFPSDGRCGSSPRSMKIH